MGLGFFFEHKNNEEDYATFNTYTTEAEPDLQFMGVYTENKSIINMVLLGHCIYKATTQAFLFSYKLNHFYTGKTPDTNMLWTQGKQTMNEDILFCFQNEEKNTNLGANGLGMRMFTG